MTTDWDVIDERPLPVSVLTGFLGSGKTTVLRHLLRQPEMSRVAVVINEFGEIGLDPLLVADCYRLDGVVTTVDALAGEATLDRHPEAIKQAAVADRLLLTKVDLAAAPAPATLSRRLRALNPAAPILPTAQGEVSPRSLFNAGYYDPE